MKRQRSNVAGQEGFAMIYLAAGLTMLLLFTGLAVDTGRAYVVQAQLTKAVDGAALGAARNVNTGDPRGEAVRIFRSNFPAGWFGTNSVTDPTADPNFFSSQVDEDNGVNTVTVRASAVLPTTFMRLGNFNDVTVRSMGEATRRMVDLCLLLDVSSSIGSRWGAVRDASRYFISSFDGGHDRLALATFSNGANVIDPMPSSRGFNKTGMINNVPNALPGGSTNMVEGLYRCWDELRTVPGGTQSGLRIIVLFTDGASNGVPGEYPIAPGVARSLRTADFPKNFPDPDNQTWNAPAIGGLFNTATGATGPSYSLTPPSWNSTQTIMQIPFLPANSWHPHGRSAGIPTQFPLQTNQITVDGQPQDSRRGLRNWNAAQNRYPAEVFNINNAARNLLEIIANEARNDPGDYRIRIFTIGMGELVQYDLGTRPEMPEDILKRVANDSTSPDFNNAQLEGKYFFAQTEADVLPAFQGIQNMILRLSK